ncbi:NUDIX domain-containing protein [Mariluticola halotolerans]|uniref:NUDIX domain-containing protein n=1 Tax=Mariluticola halotolerans TaxID=2909283 RepID=UPI0026E3F5BF|nr:NUDIX domain-containing protein [Mariluticola halotolerans]UJQ93662.1 NUDIX domain-containing protein [Mariluticola halotolerans]
MTQKPDTNSRIRITRTETLSNAWLKITRSHFDYLRSDGTWQKTTREIHDHGNAAAILLIDPKRKTVILTRQFRMPIYLNGDSGFLIEVAAGLLDDDDPETCARREAEEETGYHPTNLRFAFRTYTSPGAVTECVHCFIAEYEADRRPSAGGGLESEGEDIEILELQFEEALAMISRGEIIDAKTIMLLQYAALNQMI